MSRVTGRIIKGIGGFYYVQCADSVYECRARGLFRSLGERPLPGDMTEVDTAGCADGEGSITAILPRKNSLLRPAAANIDQALLVFSLRDPLPSFNLIDRLLIYYERIGIPAVLAFGKADLDDGSLADRYAAVYAHSGADVLFFSTQRLEGLESVRTRLEGRTTVITGPSGVGKSTLINQLAPQAGMEVGEISRRLRRGRNTTRHTELFCIGEDSFILDTPGFTSFELQGVTEDGLRDYYQEFEPYAGKCRFADCAHTGEAGCEVCMAVESGLIDRTRYDNYRAIYAAVKAARRY